MCLTKYRWLNMPLALLWLHRSLIEKVRSATPVTDFSSGTLPKSPTSANSHEGIFHPFCFYYFYPSQQFPNSAIFQEHSVIQYFFADNSVILLNFGICVGISKLSFPSQVKDPVAWSFGRALFAIKKHTLRLVSLHEFVMRHDAIRERRHLSMSRQWLSNTWPQPTNRQSVNMVLLRLATAIHLGMAQTVYCVNPDNKTSRRSVGLITYVPSPKQLPSKLSCLEDLVKRNASIHLFDSKSFVVLAHLSLIISGLIHHEYNQILQITSYSPPNDSQPAWGATNQSAQSLKVSQ